MVSAQELAKLMGAAEKACADATEGDRAGVERAVDALKILLKTDINTAVLTETQAGKRVKKLSKHTNTDVSSTASAVVECWKTAVKKEKTASGGDGAETSAMRQLESSASLASMGGKSSVGGPPGPSSQTNDGMSQEEIAPVPQKPPASTGNDKRDKARSMLAEALKLALVEVPEGDTGRVAEEVEDAILQQAGGINPAYMNKVRSLKFNLSKSDNPDLRRDVLTNMVTPQRLVTMTAEEMAPERLKAEFQAIRDKMMFEAQRGGKQKATTDQFQCVLKKRLAL